MRRIVKTACPLDCFDACGVVAEVDGDRIVRERVGWDEALDLAASKLGLARDRHGSLAVLFHRGNGSFAALKCMVDRFFNLFGGATEAVGRYCAGEGDYGTRLAFGDCQIHDPLDLRDHSNLFLIWGRNPAVTKPRQALPAHGPAAGGSEAPRHRDDDVPRDGHALLAGAGGGGGARVGLT